MLKYFKFFALIILFFVISSNLVIVAHFYQFNKNLSILHEKPLKLSVKDYLYIYKKYYVDFADILLKDSSFLLNKCNSQLDRFDIYISHVAYSKLTKKLPESGRNYVKGKIRYKSKLLNAKLRIRGDNWYHWGSYSKSWRIKLKKGNRYRKFNIINPKTSDPGLSLIMHKIASQLGLMQPSVRLVSLYLNEKFIGPMIFKEQPTNAMLVSNNLPKGVIYAGESNHLNIAKYATDPKYDSLWNGIHSWKTLGKTTTNYNNKLMEIIQFVNEMNGEKIWDYFSINDFINFHIYLILSTSINLDDFHNWRLLFNSKTGLASLIPWDEIGLQVDFKGIKSSYTKLHYIAMKTPGYMDKLVDGMITYLKSNKIIELSDEVDKISKQARCDYSKSLYRDYIKFEHELGNLPTSLEVYEKSLLHQKFLIKANKLKIKKDIFPEITSFSQKLYDNNLIFNFRVKTITPLNINSITFNSDVNFEDVIVIEDGVVKKNSYIKNRDGKVIIDYKITPKFLSYEKGKELNDTFIPKNISLIFQKVTGIGPKTIINKEGLLIWRGISLLSMKNTDADDLSLVKMSKLPKKRWKKELVNNNLTLTQTKIVGSNTHLIISKGTSIKMKNGVSIIVLGKISINGTVEAPVKIEGVNKEKWGVVAILNSKEKNVFKNVMIRGGSEDIYNDVSFTGMVSVYNSHVNISNINLIKSLGEDAINLVQSKFSIKNIRIEDSLGDSIDVDFSEGIISDAIILNSGNDGVDIGNSKIKLTRFDIIRSRDKNISIGGKSKALINRGRLSFGNMGIAIKDSSFAKVSNVLFDKNFIDLSSYDKNMIYDGKERKIRLMENKYTQGRGTLCLNGEGLVEFYDKKDKINGKGQKVVNNCIINF